MDDGWPHAGMQNTDIPRFRPDPKIWPSPMMRKPSATDKKRRETNTADIYSMPTSPKRSTENAVHTTTRIAMAALTNIHVDGALCSTPHSLADARYYSAAVW